MRYNYYLKITPVFHFSQCRYLKGDLLPNDFRIIRCASIEDSVLANTYIKARFGKMDHP